MLEELFNATRLLLIFLEHVQLIRGKHMLHVLAMESDNCQDLAQRCSIHFGVDHSGGGARHGRLGSAQRRYCQTSCLVSARLMLLDEGEGVLHANQHERLHEKPLVECEADRVPDRQLLGLLLIYTLLEHLVKLLLLG